MRALILAAFIAVGVAWDASARDMALTIYDDGKSCPGGCDAHVVINADDNGTRFAFDPQSSRSDPRDCRNGQLCRICFGEEDASCMTALYRGGGPPVGKFDFTPAFYNEHCGEDGIPDALADQCEALDRAVDNRDYDVRINCFENPEHDLCREVVEAALAAQEADNVERDSCLAMGEQQYNNQQSDPNRRRTFACNYTQARLGGPNSQGVFWRLLLPGACRAGTFVGHDGLDCCSTDVRFAASVHRECTPYFPLP